MRSWPLPYLTPNSERGGWVSAEARKHPPTWAARLLLSDFWNDLSDSNPYVLPFMDPSYDKDSWVLIETSLEANTNAAADAAQHNLSQNRLRHALKDVCESVQWYSLSVLSRANAPLKNTVSLLNVIQRPLDDATTIEIEESLAREDADVNTSLSLQNAVSVEESELEHYSNSTAQALHTIFHESTALPCNCQRQGRQFRILDDYICALRLDGKWDSSGDESHSFFDSIVAVDENYQWRHIQLQIPKFIKQVRFEDITTDGTDPTDELLTDFCRVVESCIPYHRIPIRIGGSIPDHKLYKLDPVFIDDCPEDHAPIPLSKALRENLLSARSKIHLAFTLSKSFWQYYESDWMRAAWNFETVYLLPKLNGDHAIATLHPEVEIPFLTINATTPHGTSFPEYEPQDPSSGMKRMHRYPYILNLCLLLVLICTETGSPPAPPATMDEIYYFCAGKTKHKRSTWPVIDLVDKHKQEYRRIVTHCLPQPCKDICRSLVERRAMLRDNVVRPLYDLLQRMQGPDTDDASWTEVAGLQTNSRVNTDVAEIIEIPSEESRTWINNIESSSLHCHILGTLKNDKRKRKPKIAIIDTGYDGKARWLSHQFKARLSQQDEDGKISQNWKDFWGSEDQPRDDFGHGTSMLHTVLRIAPFADVCVARIAGSSEHLRKEPSRTSKNLAEAIHWAAEVQKADIISLSLGWSEEKFFEERPVVSNAISDALRNRDQKVLFFAAASNYGGGRRELFPAKHPQVFSIRATNTLGKHKDFNPPLPEIGGSVVGTLGVGVPTKERTQKETCRTGTSVATAVAAGLAAIVVGYMNIHGEGHLWNDLRTHDGFERLLHYGISTEPEARKRFMTLERLYGKHWQKDFESCLNSATTTT